MAVHPMSSGPAPRRCAQSGTEPVRLRRCSGSRARTGRGGARPDPRGRAREIAQNAPKASLARAKEIEAEISHDMMAIVKSIAEVCGESGRWVHYGATSNDILDTATGLHSAQALDLTDAKLRRLLGVLIQRARRNNNACRSRQDTRAAGCPDDVLALGLPSGQANGPAYRTAGTGPAPPVPRSGR